MSSLRLALKQSLQESGQNPAGEDEGTSENELSDAPVAQDDSNSEEEDNSRKPVTPPDPQLLHFMRHNLSLSRARRHVAPGLRVKVRFILKDGSKQWFGGRIRAVSKVGSKIRIKYDDGTTEVTRFPDKDVIVDDTDNGTHEAPAEKFIPSLSTTTTTTAITTTATTTTTALTAEQTQQQTVVKRKRGRPPKHTKPEELQKETKLTIRIPLRKENETIKTPRETNTPRETALSVASSPETPQRSIHSSPRAPRLLKKSPRSETREETGVKADVESPTVELQPQDDEQPPTPSPQPESWTNEETIAPVEETAVEQQEPFEPGPLEQLEQSPAASPEPLSPKPQQESRKRKAEPSDDQGDAAGEDVSQPPPAKRIHIHIKKIENQQNVQNDASDEATEGVEEEQEAAESVGEKVQIQLDETIAAAVQPEELDVVENESKEPVELEEAGADEAFEGSSPEPAIESPAQTSEGSDSEDGPDKKIMSESGHTIAEDSITIEVPLMEDIKELEDQLSPRALSRKMAEVAPIVRSGRRAAQQANERIVSKHEQVIPESNMKKKKKRRKEDDDEEELQGAQWVQCDSCHKWRIIPTEAIDTLPQQWYCSDNHWDPKRATCDAPEQSQKSITKEKKRRRKMRLLMEQQTESVDESIKQQRSRSPKPPELNEKPQRSSPECFDEAVELMPQGVPPKVEKKGLAKKSRGNESAEGLSSLGEGEVKPSRGRGRPRRSQAPREVTKPVSAAGIPVAPATTDELDNLEWVQCEKCEKWRKLPAHVSADELPDVWYCTMNTWNPASASCDAPEDKADGLQDVGFHAGASSKLSYRNLIFGSTGRKPNRPVSERTRAAESLFLAPNDDEDAPPSVLYANSSVFVSRSRNNAASDENEGLSVLELMNHSNLWAELRAAAQPYGQHHVGTGKQPNFAYFTFETLPEEMKQPVKEVVLQAIGDETLSDQEVLRIAKALPVDNMPESWKLAQQYCTLNLVVTTLCALRKEGSVECIQKLGKNWTLADWNPRYRQSKSRKNISVHEKPKPLETNTLEPHTVSRFMKIAKPWKKARVH